MPSTAPSAAPEEAPRISGETSGLRNSPWNAVPATANAAPTSTAATTRGPRTKSTTFSTAGGTPDGWPVMRDHSTSARSARLTGYRPTVKATIRPAASTATAINRPGRAEPLMALPPHGSHDCRPRAGGDLYAMSCQSRAVRVARDSNQPYSLYQGLWV